MTAYRSALIKVAALDLPRGRLGLATNDDVRPRWAARVKDGWFYK